MEQGIKSSYVYCIVQYVGGFIYTQIRVQGFKVLERSVRDVELGRKEGTEGEGRREEAVNQL